MFQDYNTNSINLFRVFSATVNQNEINKKICAFGETKFYQLGIKLNGKTKISYNGTPIDYSGNSVLYLPKENSCEIAYNKMYIEPGNGICLFFTSEYTLNPQHQIYSKCEASTIRLFYDILAAFQHKNLLKAKSIFYNILSELDFEESKQTSNSSFDDLIKYIDDNICNINIDVTVLAEKYGCSAEHFRHKFFKEFNVSPKKYILIKRLNLAKDLLLNSNLSISDIAQQTGFFDSNYFSRYFKRNTGYTPTQFKNNCKKFL